MEKEIINYWLQTVEDWSDNYGKDYIEWKGTPGMGDAMYGLNIAFMRAFINQKPTTINIHWYHSEDYLYHYEDPETIVERVHFIHSRYMWPEMVNIEHTFNSTDTALYSQRYRNVIRCRDNKLARYWMFDPKYFRDIQKNKIVVWRASFNADPPRWFKMPVNDNEWTEIIEKLRFLNFQVVEIDYRTPISEAFYHISNACLCISYEGMWHYIAKNFFIPHLVIGDDDITKWHTPASIMKNPKDHYFTSSIHKILSFISHAETKQLKFFKAYNKLVFNDENRPRGYRD